MKTPFPVSGYLGPSTFCDRENELAWLRRQMSGGVPSVIIGIRRLGKTGLIRHFFNHIEKRGKGKGIFIDLQGTRSFFDLVEKLAEGISFAFPERRNVKIWKVIKSLRPNISFDPLTGTPQVGFDFKNDNDAKHSLRSLLDVLSKQSTNVVLAFDEFQEISNYDNPAIEGMIRSEMQAFPKVNYLFSGSKTHILNRMFQVGSRPFFGSVQKLYLEKLDPGVYGRFIHRKFKNAGKLISMDQVNDILEWTMVHTYFTQYLCNQIYLDPGKERTVKNIDRIKWQILETSKQDYYQLREILPKGQWKLLVAIGKEEKLYKPTSRDMMTTYALNTPRAITKSLESLLDNQLVYLAFDDSGEKYYSLTDVFLMRFIQNYL